MTAEKPACHPRKRFNNLFGAHAAADAIWRRQKVQRIPKRCTECGGYHLN